MALVGFLMYPTTILHDDVRRFVRGYVGLWPLLDSPAFDWIDCARMRSISGVMGSMRMISPRALIRYNG